MTAAPHINERGCPRCFEPLPVVVLQFGEVHCGNCALDFRAAVFEPPVRAVAIVQAEGSAASASCARHARNAAVVACDICGAFMCGLCRVESAGKVICAACFDRERTSGEKSATFTSWRTLGAHSALASFFFWPLSFVFGPFAVFAAIRGVIQDRRHGEESWGSAAFSILGGVFGLGFGLLVTFSMVFGRRSH